MISKQRRGLYGLHQVRYFVGHLEKEELFRGRERDYSEIRSLDFMYLFKLQFQKPFVIIHFVIF